MAAKIVTDPKEWEAIDGFANGTTWELCMVVDNDAQAFDRALTVARQALQDKARGTFSVPSVAMAMAYALSTDLQAVVKMRRENEKDIHPVIWWQIADYFMDKAAEHAEYARRAAELAAASQKQE